jgi:transaldolase
MPEATLHALANEAGFSASPSPDGGAGEGLINEIFSAGIDVDSLSARLQDEGAKQFVKSWNDLLEVIESKANGLAKSL